MNKFKQFILSFSGLTIGTHQYSFNIDDWFFEKFELSDIQKAKLNIILNLVKEERLIILNFNFLGFVTVPCDRCNDPLNIEIDEDIKMIIKIGNEFSEEDDNVVVIPESDMSYDITQFIYENVHLLLPMHRVHSIDKKGKSLCNPELIKLIDEYKPKENYTDKDIDPRWESLKKVKFNNLN